MMNPAYMIGMGASMVTSLLTTVIVWLSHSPIEPPDAGTAAAIAGLLAAGAMFAWGLFYPDTRKAADIKVIGGNGSPGGLAR